MTNATRALFVLFGGTGDLAVRKLYPSIFNLYKKGLLDTKFALLGLARKPLSNEEFRELVKNSVEKHAESQEQAEEFASHFYFEVHDVTKAEDYEKLRNNCNELDEKYDLNGNRVFYVSMAPRFFGMVANDLKKQRVLSENGGFNRLVIEKPFGKDYESAEELNNSLNAAFDEDQIFRIDHYLGKEMVQDIPVIRFSNPMINAVWNHNYIENVQVTLSESLGVEERAGYYDTAGALRDMIQNHTMQIVSLLAMDEPQSFVDQNIRTEKVKVLQSLNFYDENGAKENFVRGQYGEISDSKAYRDEDGVPEDSINNTYVAGKLTFNTPRWGNTPFYIRSGKKLADKFTRVDVVFKQPVVDIFSNSGLESGVTNNVLTIYIDPHGGVSFKMNVKDAGQGFHTEKVDLSYLENDARAEVVPEPYERLFHDILKGDVTNFASWQEVAAAWKFVDPVQKLWDTTKPDFPNYTPGTMGPKAADDLLTREGHKWVYPENK